MVKFARTKAIDVLRDAGGLYQSGCQKCIQGTNVKCKSSMVNGMYKYLNELQF